MKWGIYILSLLLLATMAQAQNGLTGGKSFLKIHGNRLYLRDKPFQNVGANLPDLFERFLRGEDEKAIRSLKTASEAGIRVARCFGSTWGPELFPIFENDREKWLSAYDRMLSAAEREGIYVIPSLLFNANMLPWYVQRYKGNEEHIVDFLTPGSLANALAVTYVTTIVERYKDDPRILLWEIGNEYNLEADLSKQWKDRPASQIPTSDHIRAFLIQMATLIKRIDKNHPVTSGNSDMRSYAWHIRQAMRKNRNAPDPLNYPMDWTKDSYDQYVEMLRFFNPPPLDILSVHLYPTERDHASWLPQDDNQALMVPWARKAADSLKMPLLVGEFAQKVWANGKELEANWVKDFLRQIREGAAPIALIWSWEFDEANPSQSPYTVSQERTPNLLRLLTETNRAIARKR
jgi:hypothetical protein